MESVSKVEKKRAKGNIKQDREKQGNATSAMTTTTNNQSQADRRRTDLKAEALEK